MSSVRGGRLRLPIEAMTPGPVVLPELAAAGLEMEVLRPEAAPGVVMHPNASAAIRATSPGPEDVLLAVAHSLDLDAQLVAPDGPVPSRGLVQQGDRDFRVWCHPAELSGPFELVIQLPLWVGSLVSHPDGPDRSDHHPPDWGAARELLRRLDRPSVWVDAMERNLARIERAWPDRVPHQHDYKGSREADRWDRQVLLDALAVLDEQGVPPHFEPFVPASRALSVPDAGYETLPLGTSHLHGYPHVPADYGWPIWDCPGFDSPRDDLFGPQVAGPAPLTFVAQINLAEVPLPPGWEGPTAGWLLFFVDVMRMWCSTPGAQHAPGAHLVDYLPPDAVLEARIPPWDALGYGRDGWRSMDPSDGYSFIGYGQAAWLIFDRLEVPNEELLVRWSYELQAADPADTYGELLREATWMASRRDMTFVGGAANSCQDDPLRSAIHGTDDDRSDDWVQLFQVASDNHTHTNWGDGGQLHVFIRRADLRLGRFERTRLTHNSS